MKRFAILALLAATAMASATPAVTLTYTTTTITVAQGGYFQFGGTVTATAPFIPLDVFGDSNNYDLFGGGGHFGWWSQHDNSFVSAGSYNVAFGDSIQAGTINGIYSYTETYQYQLSLPIGGAPSFNIHSPTLTVTVVPEPAPLLGLAGGAGLLFIRRKR